MGDIVDLGAHVAPFASDEFESETEDLERERLLVEEGLVLLAAYRNIADKDVRLSIISFVKSLSRKSGLSS